MTKFSEAVYRNNKISRQINIEDFFKEKNFEEVINNLYCPGDGCKAKLIYHRKRGSSVSGYLSRHPSFKHSENCDYSDNGVVSAIKNDAEYIDINTGLEDDGIERRKKEAQRLLDEVLNPKKKIKNMEKKSKNVKRSVVGSEKAEKIYRSSYDPNETVNKLSQVAEGYRKIGPRFAMYFPQEIMKKDSNKNIKTCAKLTKVLINQNSASVEGIFYKTNIKFNFPQSFFNGISNGVSQEQIRNELKILKKFLETSKTELYIVTMAQTKKININNLEVFVYDYRFPSFQTRKHTYNSLSTVVANIQAKVLK